MSSRMPPYRKQPSLLKRQIGQSASMRVGDSLIGFDLGAEGIDDEIREIFLEEFDEESGNLHSFYDKWKAEPENFELIRPIRRVFHTLKGSGRLVGAIALSEFSWKIESLLNRVLDESRPASDSVVSMIGIAIDALPKFQQALLGQKAYLDVEGSVGCRRSISKWRGAGVSANAGRCRTARRAGFAVRNALTERPEAIADHRPGIAGNIEARKSAAIWRPSIVGCNRPPLPTVRRLKMRCSAPSIP